MTEITIPTKDVDDSCPDSTCCQTKKNMCEQHPSTKLRTNCSHLSDPEPERNDRRQAGLDES
jgi:hypothetical protein